MASAEPNGHISRAEKVWNANFNNCCQQLELYYLTVASKSLEAGLIGSDLTDAVTNTTLMVTRQEQAQILVVALCRTMGGNPAEANNILKKFLEQASFGTLKKLLQAETGNNPAKRVFEKKMSDITALVANSLKSVSDKCKSSGLIGEETYAQITDAGARHSSHYIRKMLSQIGTKIQEDPGNLEVFKDQVLAPMGECVALLIRQLSIPDDEQEEDPMEGIDIN